MSLYRLKLLTHVSTTHWSIPRYVWWIICYANLKMGHPIMSIFNFQWQSRDRLKYEGIQGQHWCKVRSSEVCGRLTLTLLIWLKPKDWTIFSLQQWKSLAHFFSFLNQKLRFNWPKICWILNLKCYQLNLATVAVSLPDCYRPILQQNRFYPPFSSFCCGYEEAWCNVFSFRFQQHQGADKMT